MDSTGSTPTTTSPSKVCKTCGNEFPLCFYYTTKRKGKIVGYNGECKHCFNEKTTRKRKPEYTTQDFIDGLHVQALRMDDKATPYEGQTGKRKYKKRKQNQKSYLESINTEEYLKTNEIQREAVRINRLMNEVFNGNNRT